MADLKEATERWALQFGLTVRDLSAERARLACDDEPCAVELLADAPIGFHHVAYELAQSCSTEQARAHLAAFEARVEVGEGRVRTADADGNVIVLLPYREPVSRLVAHARPAGLAAVGHPRRLGHVNFLTGDLQAQLRFYTEGLGMRLTDTLGDSGAWVHVGSDHHVMALIDHGDAHFHHLAFELVDIGHMRVLLDHLGRHGRWLGWGPARHGVGGNIASYVRIVEEECFVELYCDMEQLQADHQPRQWPDDRYSSNTWGPLPPRSYFRFDSAAIESERESLEMLGVPLPDPEVRA
ncbi:MAG TPA: VOC family protein [Solirubrobacteraceae bacterium]|nr:VOC family protein [Solirubrobacteraceae bacterium]